MEHNCLLPSQVHRDEFGGPAGDEFGTISQVVGCRSSEGFL